MLSTFCWSSFSLFFSATSTQDFLMKCYQNSQFKNAEQKSYENCYPFIYYLEHGRMYYDQAKKSPLMIQPILFFYGLVHLIKACILTMDPNYPETTSVLAHGVSTRKRKKQQYQFIHDEVKIQKNGLFPHMSEMMFQMKHLEGDKMTMGDLLKQVPELDRLFNELEGINTFSVVKEKNGEFYIPLTVLDAFCMTAERFVGFFVSKAKFQVCNQRMEDSFLIFKKEEGQGESYDYTPLRYNVREESYSLPFTKGNLLVYNELLIHYLLLYNLSMIARYETEWWSELVKTMPNKDYPFIETFLNITQAKGPFLIYQYLMSKK